MGYRSDVYVKTTKEGVEYLKEKAKEIMSYAEINPSRTGKFMIIKFTDIKWYERFDDVDDFMAAIHELNDDEDLKIPYSFIRLGEDREDIDHRCNYDCECMPDEIAYFEPIVQVYDPEVEEAVTSTAIASTPKTEQPLPEKPLVDLKQIIYNKYIINNRKEVK